VESGGHFIKVGNATTTFVVRMSIEHSRLTSQNKFCGSGPEYVVRKAPYQER
jgi:hypothetical protein